MLRSIARRPLLAAGGGAVAVGTVAYLVSSKSTSSVPSTSTQSRRAPSPWTPPDRLTMLDRLKRTPQFDLLIIGGGATGAGVALDAAARGLSVALVERTDFSSGTSSKSTKLVHGGVRYLQKAIVELDYEQYKLVKEALRERKIFLQTAPYLSQPLPIMLPLYKYWQMPYYWAGCKMYDLLAGSENMGSSYLMGKGRALEAFPMLKNDGLVGAMVYYDGQHNDSRMNVALVMTAVRHGATVTNYTDVIALHKGDDDKLSSATVKDRLTGQAFEVRAKGIINATGPLTDNIFSLASGVGGETHQPIVQPSSGVHITLPSYYSPRSLGLIDPQTSDGRVIFFLPWQGQTIAGTTDTPSPVEETPVPREEEIQWILEEIRTYLSPDIKVRRGDVLSAWSGLRPLVRDPSSKNKGTAGLVRSHLIHVSDNGLLTIAGGKWTTYRAMAEETVDRAIAEFGLRDRVVGSGKSTTEHVRLIGSDGWTPNMFISLIQRFGIDTDVAKHLASNYGDRAWTVCTYLSPTNEQWPLHGIRISPQYPYIEAEVRYAVHHEYAQTAIDFLSRRSRLSFLNANAALEALPRVIHIMGNELQWSGARRRLEYERATKELHGMGIHPSQVELDRSWSQWASTVLGFADEVKSATTSSRSLFSGGEVDQLRAAFLARLKGNQATLPRPEVAVLIREMKGFEKITDKQINYVMREAGFESRPELQIDEFIEICAGLREIVFLPVAADRRRRERTRIPVEKSGGGV